MQRQHNWFDRLLIRIAIRIMCKYDEKFAIRVRYADLRARRAEARRRGIDILDYGYPQLTDEVVLGRKLEYL
jgi:hypothetical protein